MNDGQREILTKLAERAAVKRQWWVQTQSFNVAGDPAEARKAIVASEIAYAEMLVADAELSSYRQTIIDVPPGKSAEMQLIENLRARVDALERNNNLRQNLPFNAGQERNP